MEINSELLKKYASGLCTEQERLEVEAWLSVSNDDIQLPSKELLSEAKSKMWSEISPVLFENAPIEIPLYKKIIHYAAAACVIIALLGTAYLITSQSKILNTTVALDNSANKELKNIEINGLELTLMPYSNAITSLNTFSSKGTLSFQGYVRIVNNSDRDMQFEVTPIGGSEVQIKKIRLKKNSRYLAFISEKNEAYVMNNIEVSTKAPARDYFKLTHTFNL